ncbi:hypothetical protein [Tahibacter amnicola]|uniref:Uncharacterized protein n=1 Tax=Tahibacter amnicola TaxID=2976241 RepID=A0ABY6BPI2_9GAMM|nr:hypothetical protein [Tahibacter amnicola]UXI70315.1 hypothetical protein N4264_11960 [Tahibacter amnicola]
MSHSRDDDDQADAAVEYSIHDLLVPALSEDHHDFPHIVRAARHVRETTLATLRTVAQLLRSSANSDDPPRSDLVHDVGRAVAQLADIVDALTTLESHADYQWQRSARKGSVKA